MVQAAAAGNKCQHAPGSAQPIREDLGGQHVRTSCLICECAQSLSHIQLFRDSMDCSPPGSSVHGILQARRLGWVAISFFRGSSPPRDWTHNSCHVLLHCSWIFTTAPGEAYYLLYHNDRVLLGFPWWLRQLRICLWCGRPGFNPCLVGKAACRREWPPTPVFLPGEIHGQKSLVGCRPWGRTEADTTLWVTTTKQQQGLVGFNGVWFIALASDELQLQSEISLSVWVIRRMTSEFYCLGS